MIQGVLGFYGGQLLGKWPKINTEVCKTLIINDLKFVDVTPL